MEIEVTQEKLSKALSAVSRVAAGSRSTLPILANVLIRAEKNKVCLIATNLDMAIVEYVPVISAKDGVITVPARLITEFVSNLPKGEKIKLKADGVKLKITSGKYTSTINGASADDFPELPEIDEEQAVKYKIGVDEFKVGMSEIVVAASNDTTRPALTGVYFNTDNNILYIAASDGYRLAERKFISDVSSEVKVIVPTASLQEVLRSLSDDMEEIELVFDELQARFRMGEIEITSKLIDGTYPDYRRLIPEETDIEIVLDRAELTRITKMAAVFSREANQTIICEVDSDKGIFSVSSILNEAGENRSEIEVKADKSGKVKVDSRYLMSALNSLEEDKLRFGMSVKMAPVLIRNEKSNDYRHIVMPLNI